MSCGELLTEWAAFGEPGEDQAAQISLQWPRPAARAEVETALAGTADATRFEVEAAFPGELAREGATPFWIVTFPDLTAAGTERLAFETARCLKTALDLASSRPVLVDSLVGAAAVASRPPSGVVADAIFGGLCSSKDAGPDPRGWAPLGLGVLGAWKTTRGAGVTVASIDTGLGTHSQLAGVATSSKAHLNLIEGGADAVDPFSTDVPLANPGHGTLVASVVASRGSIDAQGGTGGLDEVTGSAPEAEILPIRAIRSVIDIRQSRIPAAIEHAIAQDCDVIVMALGSAFVIEPVEAALRKAAAAGIVTVCAAGNCYGPVVFPAKMAPLGLAAAVAAVDYAYQPWEKTSKGPEVTVSAFGEAVWGARQNASNPGSVEPSQGTTLAASLTAGIAALWVGRHGRTTLRDAARAGGVTVQKLFNEAVQKTAYRPSGWPRGLGAGLVNAEALLGHPLDAAMIPADVSGPSTGVTPLSRFLPAAVAQADALAGQEASRIGEDYAAEALWRFYVGSARARAQASGLPAPPPADPGGPRGRARSAGLSGEIDGASRLDPLL